DDPTVAEAVVDTGDRVNGTVGRNGRRHIHARAYHAARKWPIRVRRGGRCCRRAWRPGEVSVEKPSDAHRRRVRNQRRIADLVRAVVGRDLDQPAPDRGLRAIELNHVVVHVAEIVDGGWPRDKRVRINRSAERVDPTDDGAAATLEFEKRTTGAHI